MHVCWHLVLSITAVPKKPAESCFQRFCSQVSLIGYNLHKISLSWLHISDKIFYFIRLEWGKEYVYHRWLVFLPLVRWLSATLSPEQCTEVMKQFVNVPFNTVVTHSMITKLVHTWLASGNQIEINKKKRQRKAKKKRKVFYK